MSAAKNPVETEEPPGALLKTVKPCVPIGYAGSKYGYNVCATHTMSAAKNTLLDAKRAFVPFKKRAANSAPTAASGAIQSAALTGTGCTRSVQTVTATNNDRTATHRRPPIRCAVSPRGGAMRHAAYAAPYIARATSANTPTKSA